MNPSKRIEHKITSYRPYKFNTSTEYSKNNKENISKNNNIQNIEVNRIIKPSISSNNCTLKNNNIPITSIKRNNSNTKISITHPVLNKKLESNSGKGKYIVTIIDRKQKILDNNKNNNNLQHRNPSFTRLPHYQNIENKKPLDKSFDLGQSHSQTRIYNKYIPKNIANYSNNYKTSVINSINNNNIIQRTERRNIYNSNINNYQNNQERLSTEPRNNYNIYVLGSSNKSSENLKII